MSINIVVNCGTLWINYIIEIVFRLKGAFKSTLYQELFFPCWQEEIILFSPGWKSSNNT